MKRALSIVRGPVVDFWSGMDRCLDHGMRGLVLMIVGMLAGWWIYVPVHELMHVLGCVITGGEVRELQVDALYGGTLLAGIFDFVVVGSDYAGQLTDFDRTPDARYLSTVVMPFVLTVFPGVWLLRRFGSRGRPFLFGAVLPMALAPFMSWTGDAYETGSIVATWLPPWSSPAMREILRGDDIVMHAGKVAEATPSPWLGWAVAALVGTVWAFGTYALGAGVANRLPSPESQAQRPSKAALRR